MDSLNGSCILQAAVNELPNLLTGFSDSIGMVVSAILKQNLSTTFPFFDLDFPGLNFILAHEMILSSPATQDR